MRQPAKSVAALFAQGSTETYDVPCNTSGWCLSQCCSEWVCGCLGDLYCFNSACQNVSYRAKLGPADAAPSVPRMLPGHTTAGCATIAGSTLPASWVCIKSCKLQDHSTAMGAGMRGALGHTRPFWHGALGYTRPLDD